MPVGPPLEEVDGRNAFPFAITTIVVQRSENHRVVRFELREFRVSPMRGELRRQFGVILLGNKQGSVVLSLSHDHV